MKILVLHGSPRNGNTLKLTQKFEAAMKKHGDVNFDYVSVSELDIRMCKGCFACVTKGENLCPLKDDDVKLVLEKMDEVDGTIFAAPTYMYSIPAVMKGLVDRLAYLGHRPRYVHRHAVAISTTCEVGLEEALKYLSLGTAWSWGFQLVGTLGAETHPFFLNNKRQVRLDKKTRNLAKEFHEAIASTKMQSVGFGELVRFRAMSKHSVHSKEIFSADYEFYKQCNENGNRYFVNPVRIGFFVDIASRILTCFVGRSMGKARRMSNMEQRFLE